MAAAGTRKAWIATVVAVLATTGGAIAAGAGSADAATTSRLAGADRYATAAAVSPSQFASGVPVVYIATGKGYADAGGNWWIGYHAWDASCTNDACGGKRKLYVASLAFR